MPAFASSAAMIAFVPPLADTLISFASGTPTRGTRPGRSTSTVRRAVRPGLVPLFRLVRTVTTGGRGNRTQGTSRSRRAGISDVEAVAGEEHLAARLLQDDGDVAVARREPQGLAARELPLLARRADQ